MVGPIAEAEWEAQDDARSLARAEQIKADPARLKAAQEAAKKLVKERREDIAAFSKVAGKQSQDGSTKPSGGSVKRHI